MEVTNRKNVLAGWVEWFHYHPPLLPHERKGSSTYWGVDKKYSIGKNLERVGPNLLSINVFFISFAIIEKQFWGRGFELFFFFARDNRWNNILSTLYV